MKSPVTLESNIDAALKNEQETELKQTWSVSISVLGGSH